MSESVEQPPQPLPNVDSEGYWRSLADGVVAIQRCADCRSWQFPPLERCRHCNGTLRYEALSGRGTIHTFLIEHHKVAPGFDALRPYAIALVTPEEAPELRIPGRVVGVPPDQVRIGDQVTIDVEPLPGGEYRVPLFRIEDVKR